MHWDRAMTVGSPLVLPQHLLIKICVTSSFRLLPSVGGSVIAYFLCGIFTKYQYMLLRKKRRTVQSWVVSLVLKYQLRLEQSVQMQVMPPRPRCSGFVICAQKEKLACAIAQLRLHCPRVIHVRYKHLCSWQTMFIPRNSSSLGISGKSSLCICLYLFRCS